MNIQIFGNKKSFDSKKAERWFKERRIKYQYIDLPRYGMSAGEYRSLKQKLAPTHSWTPNAVPIEGTIYALYYPRCPGGKAAGILRTFPCADRTQWKKTAHWLFCPDIWESLGQNTENNIIAFYSFLFSIRKKHTK